MLFQLTSPNVLEHLANSYIRKQVDADSTVVTSDKGQNKVVSTESRETQSSGSSLAKQQEAKSNLVDFRFITSILWFVLAYLLVQYYQRSILVDRQYTYLEKVETQLGTVVGTDSFTREGKFYHEKRPKFLKHVRYLYGPVFISLLAIVVTAKVGQEAYSLSLEWPQLDKPGRFAASAFGLIDLVIALVIGYYTVLYARWLLHAK